MDIVISWNLRCRIWMANVLWVQMREYVDTNGYLDVIAHGTPNGIQITHNGQHMTVDHRTASRLIQNSDGYNGQTIMELLVVSSSLLVIRPSPYFCFARANALSTAILSALSLYSVFRSVTAFFFGLPRDGPDKRILCSLQ